MAQNFYLFGNKLVIILSKNGDKAFVKVVKGGPPEKFSVSMGDLKSVVKSNKEPLLSKTQCPNCGTDFPNYRPGVECPGCSLNFKEWMYGI